MTYVSDYRNADLEWKKMKQEKKGEVKIFVSDIFDWSERLKQDIWLVEKIQTRCVIGWVDSNIKV